MSFTTPSGFRRPVIDVNSENLMFVWNLPRWIDISEIKRTLQPKFGRIKFVETFEAWREGRRMGQIILDFATRSSLSAFTTALSNKDVFDYDGVEFMCFDPKIGQRPFFNFVRQQTGIDLVSCGGVPPSFEYKRKGPSFERQHNSNNGSSLPPPRVRDAFASQMRVERDRRYDRDDDERSNGARPSPRGVGRGFGKIGSRFGNSQNVLRSHSDNTELTTAAGKNELILSNDNDGGANCRSESPIGGDEKGAHSRDGSPIGSFGYNPPSRFFTLRSNRPKPSFFGQECSDEGAFSVVANEGSEKDVDEVSHGTIAHSNNVLTAVEENCPEEHEVNVSFEDGDGGGWIGHEAEQQQREDEENEAEDEGKGTPSAEDGEESTNKSDERNTDSSFTQYREKSRSREDSLSDGREGRGGGGGVKNTLKITELDFGFDISKILEALQTVGEVVRFERLGKTSAAFTFDDAAEAANASVLVVDDLAAPNAFFQLMTAEEAYQ